MTKLYKWMWRRYKWLWLDSKTGYDKNIQRDVINLYKWKWQNYTIGYDKAGFVTSICNHKDTHDCFHTKGGVVGHYYLRSNIPGLERFDSKTIIARIQFAKFFPFTTKILSNYTCTSAPKER